MSDIATKLTYLDGTKQALKESINNIGGDITNETTFREYAQELDNIYDNLPKTTGEGTNLSLTTLKGKMNIIPKGDTKQTQYSGYNLLDINSVSVSTEKASYTKNETGYDITTNSQASSTTYGRIVITTSFIDSSKNYGVSFDITSNVAGNYTAGWIGASKTTTGNVSTNTKKHVFVTLTGITTTSFSLAFYAANASVKVENLQIFEGTTDKTYEPYVGGTASPNPSYPQDIEVVTGTQEVKVSGNEFAEIETQTLNDMKITKTDNGYILNGTASANTTFRATITNATNTNKTICAKCDTTITNANVQIKTRNSSASQLRSISLGNANTWVVSSGTFEDYYCDIYVKSGTTLSNVLVQPMLLEGTFTTSNLGKYQPYNEEQTQIVSLGDIELCKIGTYQDYLYKTSGKNVIDWANINYSNLNGASSTRTGNEYNVVAGDTQWGHVRFTQMDLNLKPNTNYVFRARIKSTTNTNGARLRVIPSMNVGGEELYSNGTTAGNVAILSFTTPSTIPSDGAICLYPYAPNTNATFSEIMIYEGTDTTLPYEPYGSGIWYKKENITNIQLTSSMTWNSGGGASGVTRYYSTAIQGNVVTPPNNDTLASALSNIGIVTATETYTGSKLGVAIHPNGSIFIDSSIKDSLSSKEVWLYYVLATPNDIQITNTNLIEQLDNLEKLKSYNGVTNISSSGNLSAILGVSAIKGE